MLRILKLTVLGALGLLVLAVVALWIGASMSLDRSRAHSLATAALPGFTESTTQRLVQINANGYTFRARIGGFDNPNPKGDMLLLHGFPETSIMYEPLIRAASQAGFRVVAFDQRGYSPGARPEGRSSYAGNLLVDDALAVVDAVGFERFHLVGHDWGAAVGWQLVFTSPDRLLSYSALSIPHVAAFGEALANDPDQQRRSAYMGFFWLPWIPEQAFTVNDFGMLRGLYGEHPQPHLQEYMAVFSEPGAMTGALNWYRAAADGDLSRQTDVEGQQGGQSQATGNVVTPILFIWGNQDQAVGRKAVEGQSRYIDGPLEEIELDTGHWLMATATEEVVGAVMDFVVRFSP